METSKNGPILMHESPNFLSWRDSEPPANNDKEKSNLKNHLDPLLGGLSTYSGAYGSHTIEHSIGSLVLTQFIDK